MIDTAEAVIQLTEACEMRRIVRITSHNYISDRDIVREVECYAVKGDLLVCFDRENYRPIMLKLQNIVTIEDTGHYW